MELESVAEIIGGVLISREQCQNQGYKQKLFNFNDQEMPIIDTKNPLLDKKTQKNDIIFRLIYPNKVALITNKEYENCLISSQMCIIRANPNIINPLFLKWYLESKMGKENLAVHISGTSIQKITINALRKIKIPILDLDIQNKLSNLIELWSQEKGNLEKIIYQKELLYSSLIENIIIEKEK